MKVIYKYPIESETESALNLPQGAKVLSAQEQRGVFCIWAEVDTDAPLVSHHVYIIGTGWPIDYLSPNAVYVGTVQNMDAGLVWHVYIEVK